MALELPFRRMSTVANRDAQYFRGITPTGMNLVSSASGVSHSPAEYTDPENLKAGASVLLDVISTLIVEEHI